MSAFDKVIGYEKEKKGTVPTVRYGEESRKICGAGGKAAARYSVARCAGRGQNADGIRAYQRNGKGMLYLP